MPRINTSRTKTPPSGFEKLKPTLTEFELQLKEVQSESNKTSKLSAKANESVWEVFQITHQRSRYIYEMFYKRKAISKELYEWLLKEKYADKMLIAKWKKKGYEKLCCLKCIQSDETTHGNTCICRVPRTTLEKNSKDGVVTFKQCIHCGCNGCASTD